MMYFIQTLLETEVTRDMYRVGIEHDVMEMLAQVVPCTPSGQVNFPAIKKVDNYGFSSRWK